MAIYKRDIVDINLETGSINRSFLNHSIGYLDNAADHFGVRTFRNGAPVDLTGVSVQGIFMPPTGSPIAITSGNIVSGNVAEVVLPQACYNYEGQFTLAIKLVGGGVTGTMRIVDGIVDNTHASGTVAPTSAVPTYQEILSTYDDMVAATAAANGAIAATYSSSSTYAVGDYCIHDGGLYRCTTAITTAEAWTSGHWTAAKLGPDLADAKKYLSTSETLQISVSSNIKTWYFEFSTSGAYIKLPGDWYIRNGNSFTKNYDDIVPSDHATSPSGVTDCIFIEKNKMLAVNNINNSYEIVSFSATPADIKYTPVFIISIIPMYGGSYSGINGGIGRYLFDSWYEYVNEHRIAKNIAYENAVFYVRANARTNMYFEPWVDGIYIKLNGTWYIRNIVSNDTAYADILSSDKVTSPKGITDCIKLESYKRLVFDTSDSTYKILANANYTADNPYEEQKYIDIFRTAIIPYDGATLVDIVSGAGLGIYLKWLHYSQKVENEDLYIFINNGFAVPHHFNNCLERADGQDIAVYNGTIFSCDEGDCTVDGVTFSMTNGHANAVSFGDELHGDFPYLYCSDFYHGKVYVNQVTATSATLIDTINLENAEYLSNAVVDEANSIIYAFITSSSDPESTNDVYFKTYDMSGKQLSSVNIGSFPLLQGMTFDDGKIYVLSGYGTNNGGKLTIFDTSGNVIGGNALPFVNKLSKQEPQGISIDKVTHVLYMATRYNILY